MGNNVNAGELIRKKYTNGRNERKQREISVTKNKHMAVARLIQTSIWYDDFFFALDQDEKLLFFFFLTNPHTNIGGVYQVPKAYILL